MKIDLLKLMEDFGLTLKEAEKLSAFIKKIRKGK